MSPATNKENTVYLSGQIRYKEHIQKSMYDDYTDVFGFFFFFLLCSQKYQVQQCHYFFSKFIILVAWA